MNRLALTALALLLMKIPVPAQTDTAPIIVPPPPIVAPYLPFPNLATTTPMTLDEANNGIGLAQQMTRKNGWQGRLLWIDGTANLERVNTPEKIAALVKKAKEVGFNTLVFDVKPIIGYTLYPTRYAPKLTEWVRPWGTQRLAFDFDPLAEMVRQAQAQKIGLMVNLNAFSEGHREFGKGPGYNRPEWQTVLYEPALFVQRDAPGAPKHALSDRTNNAPRTATDLALYTDTTTLSKVDAKAFLAVLGSGGVVQATLTGEAFLALKPQLAPGMALLVGTHTDAAAFLRENARLGEKMTLITEARYIPISQRPEKQVPLMVNPHHPEVRQRTLDMVRELVERYAVDGVIYDDRLRYASLNADFSEETRRQFEAYIGKTIRWPDDVFRYEYDFPTLKQGRVPGAYYDAFLTFRALHLRNWLAEVVQTVRSIRSDCKVATYVGSWYPDYADIGANWAAPDVPAGYRFLNDAYRQTGWAGLVDFVTTGCYYQTATIAEAVRKGDNIGNTIEAAGQFTNRAVNDLTFAYAGISLDRFKGKPDELRRALQVACATTQGVMCFDLSHDIEPLWSVFAEAFAAKPADAPHQVAGAIEGLRKQKAARKAAGIPDPPAIQYRGTSGTGF